MQQTETYQLNLIETSDTFSPAPLNENTQKLEGIIAAGTSAEAQARADADAALDARVTVLEGRKIVAGIYIGNGASATATIHLGFTPIAVIAQPPNNFPRMAVQGTGSNDIIKIVDGGFQVTSSYLNENYGTYRYFAVC